MSGAFPSCEIRTVVMEGNMRRAELTSYDRDIIRGLRLFESISDQDLEQLAGYSCVRTLNRSELLFENGQLATSFYAVVCGWVKVFNRRPDGSEAVLGTYTKGETFAEAALFSSGYYSANAEAVTDARVIEFDGDLVRDEKLKSTGLFGGMLASLSGQLQGLTREIDRLQNRNGEQRVAHFILSLCTDKTGSATIRLPYEKALIATRLGLKPETLSRIFPKLRDVGVTVRRDNVSIEDVDRLRRHCS